MAWDPATQHEGMLNGARVEFGSGIIGSDGTLELATMLAEVNAISLTGKSNPLYMNTLFSSDLTITSGKITIRDPAGAPNEGRTFTYLLLGLP